MESNDPPVNDLECREPAPMSIDRSFSIVDYYNKEQQNFKTILEGVGVVAVLTILGFFIYQIFK